LLRPLPHNSGVPLDALNDMVKIAGKRTVISHDMARVWDAIFVIGTPTAIKELTEHPATAIARQGLARGVFASAEAIKWLSEGEFGLSAYAIFHKMTGQTAPRAPRATAEYPHDAADLRRCLLLLEAVPEFKERFSAMREVSPTWARLVDAWDELTTQFTIEAPLWKKGRSTAPLTCSMMRRIVDCQEDEAA
jgi:hypothetical protein